MTSHSQEPVEPILKMSKVCRTFATGRGRVHAVVDASFEIHRGQFLIIRGPSGSGKSTLLHMAAAMLRPTQGVVRLFDQDTSQLSPGESNRLRATRVGVILPMFDLVPYLDAVSNVCLGAGPDAHQDSGQTRRSTARVREQAEALLDSLGMQSRLRHRPSQLSAGEQRRVLVARGLINQPELLFCDEPTANLDPDNAARIEELLRQQTTRGTSVLMVTHAPLENCDADQVWQMDLGRLHPCELTTP